MVPLKGRLLLAIIWSKANLIAARRWEGHKARQQVFTAEVVPFSLVSHPKEKSAADAQEGVYGTASGGCFSKVGDHEAGMEA